ncbi:MAG: protein-L-isoaspartate O-methyltransferase [Sterolibacterium sp.]|nr:protein-L-isoaspartate O-methyltransferase [Sterolibacterium sp.]
MNLEQARFNMIEQQLRPWNVLDQDVLDLLYVVKREDFVPPAYRLLAFSDAEIPLGHGATMLPPKIEAHILQALKLSKSERVLEIGTGSGYMAALLAAHAAQVVSVDIVPELAAQASANLSRNGVNNVIVATGDGAQGWPAQAPYDVIVVSGALPEAPQAMLDQLKNGGRLLAFVGEAPLMQAQLIKRIDQFNFRTEVLFETWVPQLRGSQTSQRFNF